MPSCVKSINWGYTAWFLHFIMTSSRVEDLFLRKKVPWRLVLIEDHKSTSAWKLEKLVVMYVVHNRVTANVAFKSYRHFWTLLLVNHFDRRVLYEFLGLSLGLLISFAALGLPLSWLMISSWRMLFLAISPNHLESPFAGSRAGRRIKWAH